MFLVGCKTPLQSFLGIAEQHGGPQNGVSVCQGYPCVEGVDGDQGEVWEASCSAWPVWTSFLSTMPKACELYSGRGHSSGACNVKWLAWHQGLRQAHGLPSVWYRP